MVSGLSAADVQTSAWLQRVIMAHNNQFCCSTNSPTNISYSLLLPPGACTVQHNGDNSNTREWYAVIINTTLSVSNGSDSVSLRLKCDSTCLHSFTLFLFFLFHLYKESWKTINFLIASTHALILLIAP